MINQSVIDLLIEKKIFTTEELSDTVAKNIKLFQKLAKEYSKILIEQTDIDLEINIENDDVLDGLYYGPVGEA